MMNTYTRSARQSALLVAALSVLPAAAQTPKATDPRPATSLPSATSANYGDWSLRCQQVTEKPGQRQCEIAQQVQIKGQTSPFAKFGLTRTSTGDSWRFVALLPVNVQFPSTVKLNVAPKPSKAGDKSSQGSDKSPPTVELAWVRCVGGACAAAADLSPAVVSILRDARDAGQVTFVDAGGRNIVVPIQFNGLTQAMEAFGK